MSCLQCIISRSQKTRANLFSTKRTTRGTDHDHNSERFGLLSDGVPSTDMSSETHFLSIIGYIGTY